MDSKYKINKYNFINLNGQSADRGKHIKPEKKNKESNFKSLSLIVTKSDNRRLFFKSKYNIF